MSDANEEREKNWLRMELFVTLCAPLCVYIYMYICVMVRVSVYWQLVITVLTTIGASKCSHLTVIVGNRLQVPSRKRRFFSFLLYRTRKAPARHRSPPPPPPCACALRVSAASQRSCCSNRLDGEQVQRVERKAGLLSLEFLFLNRV